MTGADASAPEVLLFDLGGVLVDFAGFERLNALLAEPLGASAIRARWLEAEPVREFELGRIAAAEFAERVVTEWLLPVTPAEFLRSFKTWLRGFYPGVPALLGALGRSYRLACLSNSNPLHLEAIGDSLAAVFEASFISCELGLAKPDPAIFRAAVATLEVEPGAVLFFDDVEQNVEAALGVGLEAELVRGPAELRAALGRRRLLGPRPSSTSAGMKRPGAEQ